MSVSSEYLFQRSLTAHLPMKEFSKLSGATVLVAGLGSGSNVATLLARKGIGRLIIADPDEYEPHNVRQECSGRSTWGQNKAIACYDRLRDINPNLELVVKPDGVLPGNVAEIVGSADVIVDLMDLEALDMKVALHREARNTNKYVVTAPSVLNGAVLWTFDPDGPGFEDMFPWDDRADAGDNAWSHLRSAIPRMPGANIAEMYREAAYGKRTIPLDAVGVATAAVLVVGAVENILLSRFDRVVRAPDFLQVDLTDPAKLVHRAESVLRYS